MLTEYLEGAMELATYEIVDGKWVGEIPGFEGVWAYEDTLIGCKKLLKEVLEGWLLLKVKDHDPLPVVKGIDLNRVGSRLDA